MQVLPAVGNGTVSNNLGGSSLYYKGVARNGSPPWREDDKDGHYIFVVGENLTSRCNYSYRDLFCSS